MYGGLFATQRRVLGGFVKELGGRVRREAGLRGTSLVNEGKRRGWSGEQAFGLLVGLFCVSAIGMAVMLVTQSIAYVVAIRRLRRDRGDLSILNRVLGVSEVFSDPLIFAMYGCLGLAVFGFSEWFWELIGAHLGLTVAIGVCCVVFPVVQMALARRLTRTVVEYAERKDIEL